MGSDARKGLQHHPTVKPTALLVDALYDLTDREDILLNPFLGSGSKLTAADISAASATASSSTHSTRT